MHPISTRGLSHWPAWPLVGLCFLACELARAQAVPALHPWLSPPPTGSGPSNYITNLRDGDKIETPFVLKFGLSRQGLAGISEAVPKGGHHHLLVNRDLPLDFTKPLPFNDQYIHFGKGQMETVLNFKPGTYKLRMLLANHQHIPYFVYSPIITVEVTKQRTDVNPASLVQAGVSILSPRPGNTVKRPFRVQMHASGLNISHTQIKANEAGHFRLVFTGASASTLEFPQGHTEAWLRPPVGDYQMQLQFVSNSSGQVLHRSPAQILSVR
jgi:Domain of unknown function (DUF4399)